MSAARKLFSWSGLTKAGMVLLIAFIVFGSVTSLTRISSPEERLTIAVREGVTGVPLKILAQYFSEEYHIPTEVIEFPYDELYEEEMKQLVNRPARSQDEIPPFDVIMLDDPWFPALLLDPKGGSRLEQLNPETFPEYDWDDFFESTRRVSQYPDCSRPPCKSGYYALPFVGNSQLFCYREGDFGGGPPKTWQQVKDLSPEVKRHDDHLGYMTRIGPGNSVVTDFLPILWAYDPKSFSPDGEPVLSNLPAAEEAFQMLKSLVGKRNVGDASMDDFDVSAYFAKGRARMGIVWNAWAMMIASVGVRDLQCTELPGSSAPELGTWLLAIPRGLDQKTKQKALAFIVFATREEQLLHAAGLGNPPPRRSVFNRLLNNDMRNGNHNLLLPPSVLVTEPGAVDSFYRKLFQAEYNSLSRARPRPRTRCWKRIEKLLGEELEGLISDNLTPKQTAVCLQTHLAELRTSAECLPLGATSPPGVIDVTSQPDLSCGLHAGW